jgi:F-type H+-transporting ATPase subunit a
VLVRLGPFPLTSTMVTSFAVSILLVLSLAWVARSVRDRPDGRLAAAGRLVFRFLGDLVTQSAGRPSPKLEVFGGSLFLFIFTSSLVGQLPGVRTPTSNLAATSALAFLVFLAVPVAGMRARGPLGYLGRYLRPNPLLLPLHVISELSRTVALALRLFGNMMSGQLVVALMVVLVGFLVPVPLMALDLLIGSLQAYIFTILGCVYIGAAIQVGEEQ